MGGSPFWLEQAVAAVISCFIHWQVLHSHIQEFWPWGHFFPLRGFHCEYTCGWVGLKKPSHPQTWSGVLQAGCKEPRSSTHCFWVPCEWLGFCKAKSLTSEFGQHTALLGSSCAAWGWWVLLLWEGWHPHTSPRGYGPKLLYVGIGQDPITEYA